MRIEVSDSGIGIAADQIGHIFDEFYQVDMPTDNARDGYGLGLTIVQRVAQLLDVEIDVQSAPGTGSTFALEVPVSEGNTRHIAPTPANGCGLSDVASAKRPHALIVEDDEIVRTAMRRFLKTDGYPVTTASSVAEARACLDVAGGDTIGLIITDYHSRADIWALNSYAWRASSWRRFQGDPRDRRYVIGDSRPAARSTSANRQQAGRCRRTAEHHSVADRRITRKIDGRGW